MTIAKVIAFSVSACLLFSLNSVQSSIIDWKKLSSIQKSVLKEHVYTWNEYSENKQKKILLKSRKSIRKLTSYKTWFKKLPKKERKLFYKNRKKMSKGKFSRYVDTLFLKYGSPR